MTADIDRAIREEVVLLPYQPGWPARFAAEKQRLLDAFPGEFLAIEHFGSTAVPGLPAKPVIDILGGVRSMEAAEALLTRLLLHGYTTSREFNAMLPDRKWLMRAQDGRRTHHLHLVVYEGEAWQARLKFRDLLRTQPEVASRYVELKQRAAAEHRADREAYTEAKTEFVQSVLGR